MSQIIHQWEWPYQWEWPTNPMGRAHIDYFEYDDNHFLMMVDSYSNDG